MALNQIIVTQMETVIARLKTQWQQAWDAVADSSWLTPNNIIQARFGNLKASHQLLYDLEFKHRTAVLQGAKTYESWLDLAKHIGDNIAAQVESDTGWEDFWQQVIKKSGEDIQTALPSETKVQAYIAVAIVALVLILAIKVT